MIDCEKCKYYHDNCDGKFRCRIDVEKIKADYLDEIIDILNDSFPMTPSADITCGFYCAIERLEQLKEQTNE